MLFSFSLFFQPTVSQLSIWLLLGLMSLVLFWTEFYTSCRNFFRRIRFDNLIIFLKSEGRTLFISVFSFVLHWVLKEKSTAIWIYEFGGQWLLIRGSYSYFLAILDGFMEKNGFFLGERHY